MKIASFAVVSAFVLAACGPSQGPATVPAPSALVAASAAAVTASPWPTVGPPKGAPPAEWIALPAPQGKTVPIAVFRPTGAGPFPVIVLLHGDDGLKQRHLDLASGFAKDGFVVLTPCWFRPASATAQPLAFDCTDAPEWIGGSGARGQPVDESSEVATIISVVGGVRMLSGIRADRVALVGHSAGARAAVRMASSGGMVEAVVSISGGYGIRGRRVTPITPLVGGLAAPLLMVHGTLDQTVPVSDAREYDAAARASGKTVETIYVEGGGHDLPFTWSDSDDVRGRVVSFLKGHLTR